MDLKEIFPMKPLKFPIQSNVLIKKLPKSYETSTMQKCSASLITLDQFCLEVFGTIWYGLGWPLNLENYVSISFHTEWDMIVVTVFLSILNQMEIHLVQKIERKTVSTIIHPFNLKGNRIRDFSVVICKMSDKVGKYRLYRVSSFLQL